MEVPKKIGKYEVLAKIAAGGFGTIFKGWDPFIKRQVAIKMCHTPDEEVRQRFFREAQFVGNLVHRNITLVFDFGVENEVPYIVQEFLTGYDLDQLVKAGVLQDVKALASIMLQVCDGMDFAHHRGIVHRDLKPSNIRVLEDGTVKIMDFGIAKAVEGGSKLTQTGIALGTAGYLAPEQIQGGAVDPRTDIFALGVLTYELITGVRPFEGKSLSNVLYKILNEEPRSPVEISENCPPELTAIIEKSLAKSPADRFQSAKEMADALRAVPVDGLPGADGSVEQTTGFLRNVLEKMDIPSTAVVQPALSTTPLSMEQPQEPSPALHTEVAVPKPLTRAPVVDDEGTGGRRNTVLLTFLVLASVLLTAAGVLYFSGDAQQVVFGPDGAPWIPTPTPTATATPVPTATATATPEPSPTATPEPTATPRPAKIRLRFTVDPPAEVFLRNTSISKGRKPTFEYSLRPATYTFTLKIKDFPDVPLTKTITSTTKSVSLVAEIGQITIMPIHGVTPGGGVASLGGIDLGRLPIIRKKVPAGEHELIIRWTGHAAYKRRVKILPLPAPETRITDAAPPN